MAPLGLNITSQHCRNWFLAYSFLLKNDQHKTIVQLIYSFYSFEKMFFSLTVDYDIIDHVTLGWLEERSPGKKIKVCYEVYKIPLREAWCLNLLDC